MSSFLVTSSSHHKRFKLSFLTFLIIKMAAAMTTHTAITNAVMMTIRNVRKATSWDPRTTDSSFVVAFVADTVISVVIVVADDVLVPVVIVVGGGLVVVGGGLHLSSKILHDLPLTSTGL
jgi:hypothetical protein